MAGSALVFGIDRARVPLRDPQCGWAVTPKARAVVVRFIVAGIGVGIMARKARKLFAALPETPALKQGVAGESLGILRIASMGELLCSKRYCASGSAKL